MIVVTGATGHLGQHVVEGLLQKLPAKQIAVAVRNVAKAKDLAARGVSVREADYGKPDTLAAAFDGASKLLLISSNELGQRLPQHRAVIAAAKRAGVGQLAYTSILRADSTKLMLASEHLATENAIRESGLPFVFLRNGWYFENYTENLAPALEHGALIGSAGEGRIAAATRSDYAAAAVEVLTGNGHDGAIYELAGDESFSMAQLAAELGRQLGRTIVYRDMPQAEYAKVLESFGVPAAFANVLADSDVGITRGELDDESGQLRKLIGRGTTPLAAAVSAALAKRD